MITRILESFFFITVTFLSLFKSICDVKIALIAGLFNRVGAVKGAINRLKFSVDKGFNDIWIVNARGEKT